MCWPDVCSRIRDALHGYICLALVVSSGAIFCYHVSVPKGKGCGLAVRLRHGLRADRIRVRIQHSKPIKKFAWRVHARRRFLLIAP